MRRTHRHLVFLVVLAVASLLGGCSSYRAPTVSVGEAYLAAVTEEALRLDITLDLANPNDETLELRQFTYAVSIDGRKVYDGKRAAEAALSASGEKHLILPAVVRFDDAPWAGSPIPADAAWTIRGSLLYVTPGEIAEILLDTGVRKPRVRFSGAGRVRLPAEPAP